VVTRTEPIKLLILDIDGVLTDGTVLCSAGGPEYKRYSFRDVDAVFEARRRGVTVALVTGESTPWADAIGRRLEVDHVVKGAKDKLAAVNELISKLGVDLDQVCFLGDSPRDAAALEAVGLGLAPADASDSARSAADAVLVAAGGRGAVEEALQMIFAPAPGALSRGAAADELDLVAAISKDSLAVQRRTVDELAGAIAAAAELVARCLGEGRTVFTFGNGGSASDAEHLAAELIGRFEATSRGLAAVALSANTSVMTALGNDFGMVAVFERQLRALAKPGDVAVAISTSGSSPNIVAALETGRRLGCITIGLTGGSGGRFPGLAEHCLVVPSKTTARIQEAHRLIIHMICAIVDKRAEAPSPSDVT
jgi:D-sedoheptulose 7-phosphate isomerase